MKTKEQKFPALRFPEFEGEWEEKKLGEIATKITDGTHDTPTKTENGIPYLTALHINDGYIDYDNSYFVEEDVHDKIYKRCNPELGDLLIVNIGAGTATCAINRVDYEFSLKNVALVKPNRNLVNPQFLEQSQRLQTQKLFHYFTSGGAQPFLGLKDIGKIKHTIPSLPEQQKIANFLSATDKRLELLKDKKQGLEDYKRGAMQLIFSQELRFTRADGSAYEDWKEKKLGEVLIEVSEKTTSNNQFNTISSTAKGLFLQSDYFTREIASKNNIGYKILSLNQLVFSPQNLWLGNINVNLNFEKGIVSPSYKIYSFQKNILDVLFASYIMKTKELLYEYVLCSEMGASVVRRNLNIDLFLKIKIPLPSLEEQTQIANFLSAIDVKIEKLSEQIEATENYKKGLLQQMFV